MHVLRFEGIFEILALVIVISVVWGLVAKRFARPTDIEGPYTFAQESYIPQKNYHPQKPCIL